MNSRQEGNKCGYALTCKGVSPCMFGGYRPHVNDVDGHEKLQQPINQLPSEVDFICYFQDHQPNHNERQRDETQTI